ncbi:hypothetical protein BGZ95_002880 [Linnemannia exigua]|uniref:Uncharacterized protein n=1 Tax=Linnemannia exigua TaxID=604196 RepID=A0AAD4DI98_9FUNG|nr:hypothetical protein BGZ95_002880 [Linnemannia exigua]
MASHEYDFNALRKRKKSGEPFRDAPPSLLHSHSHSHSQWDSSQDRERERERGGTRGGREDGEEERRRRQLTTSQDVTLQVGYVLHGIISYCWDLIRGTLMILRPLFSVILALLILLLLVGALTRSLAVFRSEVQARIVCRLPLASHFFECPEETTTTAGRGMMMMQVPDFADLVNKQAASYEFIADSLNVLNPGLVKKEQQSRKSNSLRKKIKAKGASLFARRKGKNTLSDSGGRSTDSSSSVDDDEDEEDDPYGLSIHGSNFEGGRIPLPLVLKRAELAVVDLKVLVGHSSLPDPARSLLVRQLESFHNQAKVTSRKLQFLQARANGCVDGLVIRNVYLTVELDRLEGQRERLLGEGDGGSGGGGGGVLSRVWQYFAGTHDLEVASSEKKLRQLYQGTMEDASNHVRDLILQVQDVLQSLDTMDQTLSNIHELTTKERKQQKNAQGEVLSQLWAQLGGHRIQREMYKDNLHLLQDMDGQRKATVGQIQSALWKLTDFEAEIGMLRERIVDAVVDGAFQETTSSSLNDSEETMSDSFEETVKAPTEGRDKAKARRISTVSLRAHIQQIDRVTSRLKERSFLAEAVIKAQADQIPAAMSGTVNAPPISTASGSGVEEDDKA